MTVTTCGEGVFRRLCLETETGSPSKGCRQFVQNFVFRFLPRMGCQQIPGKTECMQPGLP